MTTVHLPDYRHMDFRPTGPGPALCGASGVRIMSAHEIKRGRITCTECLRAYAREALTEERD